MTDRPIFYDAATGPAGSLLVVRSSRTPGEIEQGRYNEVARQMSVVRPVNFEDRQILVDLDQLAGSGRLAGAETIAMLDELYNTNAAFHAIAYLFYQRGRAHGEADMRAHLA